LVLFDWFLKSHPNQIKPNQCGYDQFGGCGLHNNILVPNNFKHPKKELEVPK
jgi:hypothetical protein